MSLHALAWSATRRWRCINALPQMTLVSAVGDLCLHANGGVGSGAHRGGEGRGREGGIVVGRRFNVQWTVQSNRLGDLALVQDHFLLYIYNLATAAVSRAPLV